VYLSLELWPDPISMLDVNMIYHRLSVNEDGDGLICYP